MILRSVHRVAATFLAMSLGARVAMAAEVAPTAVASRTGGIGAAVDVDWARDGLLTGTGLTLLGASQLASGKLAPSRCRWCEPPGFDDAARRALVWSNTSVAGTASDALLLSIPLAFVAYDWMKVGEVRPVADDLLVVGEAAALTGLLTQVAKFSVARQRPYAWAGGGTGAREEQVSFWSAHAALGFAIAAAAGREAQLRGDAAWPWIYAVGFTAASGTGYLRLAADQHWLSDVLVGAAVGTAIGWAVPTLHRRGAAGTVQLSVAPNGIAFAGTW